MRHVKYMAGIISIALLLNISGCIGDGCCGTKEVSPVTKAEKPSVVVILLYEIRHDLTKFKAKFFQVFLFNAPIFRKIFARKNYSTLPFDFLLPLFLKY